MITAAVEITVPRVSSGIRVPRPVRNVLPLSACIWGQRLNPADEVWQVRGHHSPDFLQVDALIKVDELVPGSGNQLPGHFGMRRPEFRRHSLDRLPNYQKLVQNR